MAASTSEHSWTATVVPISSHLTFRGWYTVVPTSPSTCAAVKA